ncbi:hypothetical protein BpHYR1_029777, partial [Brachionus plicatilis]
MYNLNKWDIHHFFIEQFSENNLVNFGLSNQNVLKYTKLFLFVQIIFSEILFKAYSPEENKINKETGQ